MQISYDENNINLNYLNNYVKYFYEERKLFLYNTLYNKTVIITGNLENLKELIINLENGIETEELLKVISKINKNNKDLYQYLLQNFIIE